MTSDVSQPSTTAPTGRCEIVTSDLSGSAAQALLRELDQYLARQYRAYDPDFYGMRAAELTVPRSGFWVAQVGEQAVGCVAVRPFTEAIAELKRLYVQPAFRKRGIGQMLLATAEVAAIAWGYTHLCLETGAAQPESIRLYSRAGFQAVPCFGKYVDPESRCYQKRLLP